MTSQGTSKIIKAIISIKAILALIALLAWTGHLKLGELNLSAQQNVATSATETTAPATPTNSTVASDEAGYYEAEQPKPTRKSFLDELFSVPDIDTKNVQKEELGRYLTMVERKMKQVEDRVSLLKAREQRLLDIERSVEDKLKRLDEEKRYFLDTVQKEKQLNEERSQQLVEFYKKMPPKAAAPVFEKLDKDLVVQLFNKLPQKQITSILAQMDPATSVKLTEYYGRLRSSREYEMLREINKSLTDEFQGCKGM